jgi:UPF0148 protein
MDEDVKKMADMLRAGATMLPEQCPSCNSPIFKLRSGELWCPKCNKRIVIVKQGEETARAIGSILLTTTEEIILTKIQELNQIIKQEKDPVRLQHLGELLSTWLEVLEKVKRIQKI